jgi:hypothetical protein
MVSRRRALATHAAPRVANAKAGAPGRRRANYGRSSFHWATNQKWFLFLIDELDIINN